MTRNPFINAVAAFGYIVGIASFMYFGIAQTKPVDSVLAPIAVVSLFTLSAAVMGYIFLYQPAQMYFDNKKKPALDLFLQTVLVFGIITIGIFGFLFSGLLK